MIVGGAEAAANALVKLVVALSPSPPVATAPKPEAKDVGSVKVSLIAPSASASTSTSRLQSLPPLSPTRMPTMLPGSQPDPESVTASPGA